MPRTQSPERARPDDRVRVKARVRINVSRSLLAFRIVAVETVSTRRVLSAEGSHVTKAASHAGSITARSRRRPRPEAEAGRRLWLRAKITRQRPSERVELEFEGMGSGWFTIRFVVALPMVGAAAIA